MLNFLTAPNGIFATVVYMFLSLFFLILGRWTYRLVHPDVNVNDELVEKDNFAFAIANVGYLSGVLIALGGALTGQSSDNLLADVLDFSLYACLSIVLLNLSILINDRFILRGINLKRELTQNQNIGVGVLDASVSIATGLIIYGAVSGDSLHDAVNGSLSTIVFWLIGMMLFVLSAFVYNLILKFDLLEELKRKNLAVAIAYSGVIISIANLVRSGTQGDFISWESSGYSILYNSVIALVALPFVRVLADKLLLPGQKLTDELVHQKVPNIGAGLVEAFAYIACSILLDWTL